VLASAATRSRCWGGAVQRLQIIERDGRAVKWSIDKAARERE